MKVNKGQAKQNVGSLTPLHNQNADFVGSFPKGRARGCRLRISNAQWCKRI
jgi:hypothetical protein